MQLSYAAAGEINDSMWKIDDSFEIQRCAGLDSGGDLTGEMAA